MRRYFPAALAALLFHAIAFAIMPLIGGRGSSDTTGGHFTVRLVSTAGAVHPGVLEARKEGRRKIQKNPPAEERTEDRGVESERRGSVEKVPQATFRESEVEEGARHVNSFVEEAKKLEESSPSGEEVVEETLQASSEGEEISSVDVPEEESSGEVRADSSEKPDLSSPGEGDAFDGLSTPPRLVEMPRPRYPRLARRRGIEGVVVLSVRVSSDGTVESVKVLKSSGHSMLDEEALEAAKRARFEPARLSGTPVSSEKKIAVRFVLE